MEKEDQEFVLKAANDPAHNTRLREEAEILGTKLRHNHIVEQCGTLEIGDRFAFLMRPVFADRDERRIETLRDRLRQEGRLHVDLLQRFGDDLLDVVRYLEEEAGIAHRDLKPDNIAIGQIRKGDKLHLVLFDFSLSLAPAENIRAGTTGYLDPLLPVRDKKRWDLHAERYAAAATLFELAAGPGNLPVWGDGNSDPSHLTCEATIDGDLFDASLRDAFVEFFTRAFRRAPRERFDNAEHMLDAWRECFAGIEEPGTLTEHEDDQQLERLLESATFETQIPELGLGTRATNALDRANILTVKDLLTVSMYSLNRMRGVGQKTRREISAAVHVLRERLGTPSGTDLTELASLQVEEEKPDPESASDDVSHMSVDLLAARLQRTKSREGETAEEALQALLGLHPQVEAIWPSQTEVAEVVDVTRGRVGQLVTKFKSRWAKDAALTHLRADLVDIVRAAGGAMSVVELGAAILVTRGSVQDEPRRTKRALAVARACLEVEQTLAEPRYLVRRKQGRVLVALRQDLASYATRLGDEADKLADEDPLVPPARVLQRLRSISVPGDVTPLSNSRIIRLAAAASHHAAVSSRQELYPRGMDAARALKLSQGALYGVPFLTVEQIQKRVSGRYPDAEALPDHPALQDLLEAAGFDFIWETTDEVTGHGEGHSTGRYTSRHRGTISMTSGSGSMSRLPTADSTLAPGEMTPEIADARQFEERLDRGIKEGSFLALMVHPKYYQRAARELHERFTVQLLDLEGLFIDALQDVAAKAKVQWDLVLRTDAKPGEGDWDKLMLLIGRAMPKIEEQLMAADKTMLIVYPGLLARYDQMTLLERLREKVGRRDGIPGAWLLIPGDQQAMMDGKPIPLISPGQRTRVPLSWIQNVHRGRGQGEAHQ